MAGARRFDRRSGLTEMGLSGSVLGMVDMDWTDLAQGWDRLGAVVNAVMDLRVLLNC